jgi:hypothetical protein
MSQTKKEFALAQLAPYLKDPNICGYNSDNDTCLYLTKNGKMCIAGKNMLPEIREEYRFDTDNIDKGIVTIINDKGGQENVFISESVDILTNTEWKTLQVIHDNIAKQEFDIVKQSINTLALFTLEELEEFSGAKLNTFSLK